MLLLITTIILITEVPYCHYESNDSILYNIEHVSHNCIKTFHCFMVIYFFKLSNVMIVLCIDSAIFL